jgi:hypothetical protein
MNRENQREGAGRPWDGSESVAVSPFLSAPISPFLFVFPSTERFQYLCTFVIVTFPLDEL